jgi:hypothetical protein
LLQNGSETRLLNVWKKLSPVPARVTQVIVGNEKPIQDL